MKHRYPIIAVAGLLLVQGGILYFLGQPAICACGYVKLWEGVVRSSGNSQHIADWYTFSHMIHGMLLYAALWFLFPWMPVARRLVIAVGIEAAWEIVENTPWVIDAYRQQALARGYVGDSILNSLCDTLFMIIGFGFAGAAPVWVTVAAAVALELWVGYRIRDNLMFNVLSLIHQFAFIRRWQEGGNLILWQ